MTYQIIDKESGKAVNLNEFDRIYCEQTGETERKHYYASWNSWLEMAFMTHSSLAGLPEGHFKEQFVTDSRKLSALEFARVVFVWIGKTIYTSDTPESVLEQVEDVKNLIKFLLANQDKYEFTHF